MPAMHLTVKLLQLVLILCWHTSSALGPSSTIDLGKTLLWGPGLNPDFFVPVRYFFIQPVTKDGEK